MYTGYLAESAEGYATCLRTALSLSPTATEKMRYYARESVRHRFPDTQFETAIEREIKPILEGI